MMYTENNSHNLQASTSVPLLFTNTYGRKSLPNSMSNNYSNFQTNQKGMSQGLNLMKPNNFRMQSQVAQKEKQESYDLSSSLNFTENKKFMFTHNQMDEKSFRFQFKRNSAAMNRTGSKLDQSKDLSKKQSNIYSNYAIPTQNYSKVQTQSNISIGKEKVNQLEEKIKDLQNRLKFQEKYANDLYINSEDVKKQCSRMKEENIKLKQAIDSLTSQHKQLNNQIQSLNSMYQYQLEQKVILNHELQQRLGIIQSLEHQKERHLKEITALNEKIENFDVHFKNQLYQERIKQLSQEIIKTRTELTQVVIEKNRLQEELKSKNEKLICLNLDSPSKSKEMSKAFNASQKTNQAINMAFEQSIRLYKKDIEQLKQVIQKQHEDHRLLSEEISSLNRQIQILKQDEKISALKYRTQNRNLINQNDRRMTQKTNEISSLNNRLTMLQQKYAKALKQINDKDQFLHKHLVGRAKDLQQKQYIQQIMQSYQQTFESRLSLSMRLKELQKQGGGL